MGDVFNKVINNVIDASKVVKVTIRLNADKKNYNEFIKLINFIYASGVNKKNIKIHYAQLRNYTNEKTTEDFLDDYEYFLSKTRFYKEQQIKFEIDRNTKFIPSFNGKSFCGLAQKNNFVIDDYGNLYKCEHYLGDKDKIVGDVVNGLYYNEQLTKAIQDEKCSMCELYPCCNYVQCPVMYEFTGQEKCMVYPNQNKTIKSKIKNYIGANTYDKETEKKS